MAEHNRLTGTPVFIKDIRAVLGSDRRHVPSCGTFAIVELDTHGSRGIRLNYRGRANMTENDRALPALWFEEVWNKGRREAIAEMLTPESVVHDGDTHSVGPDGFYPFFDRLGSAFSDFQVVIHDTVAEGDRV